MPSPADAMYTARPNIWIPAWIHTIWRCGQTLTRIPPSGKTNRKATAPRVAWAILASAKYAGNLGIVTGGFPAAALPVTAGFVVVSHGEDADTMGTVGVAGEAYSVCAMTSVVARVEC